ncbi:flagellar basal body P-ring formation chaperone FlgA [Propionivibrio soli]|jgi:flagella basal body P-ring formation protein FlgA|uniref:flagellar basal body P-ring formation chaperone FlgA n=1 Tax=Propionivibrio soli TaxID=2976531 RepID=UPI0021E75B18|nr:flagellar basal body P-ring formation chaperone FlgA [Propionivibrio soli]
MTRRLASLVAALWFASSLPAFAQMTPSRLQGVVEDFLRTQTQGLPGKVDFKVAPPDARTRLADCDAFEPFLPSGSLPWGKTTVGVRCLGPSSWTAYVQAQVSIRANYLVAARTLSAGQVLDANDITTKNGDLGALPQTVLTDVEQAVGKTVKLGIVSGQPVRSDQLIAPWAVQQGQTVKTVSRGVGFSATSEGRALNNALEGQLVQVRTPSGQTVSGIARPGGVVEISH